METQTQHRWESTDARVVGSSRQPMASSCLRSCTSKRFDLVGIDMPIGLIDGPPRACDVAARKYLGRAGSSVFPAPPRASLSVHRLPSRVGCRASRYRSRHVEADLQPHGEDGRARCVDRLDEPEHRSSKSTPSAAFKMLNGGADLPSKKTPAGQVRSSPLARRITSTCRLAATSGRGDSTTCSTPTRCCGA